MSHSRSPSPGAGAGAGIASGSGLSTSGSSSWSLSSCTNLADFLRTLPANIKDGLYKHPATCLAVFRELPALSQNTAMRLLHVEVPIPQAVISSWTTTQNRLLERESSDALTQLGVWEECSAQGGVKAWALNKDFQANLKTALLGGGHPWSTSHHLEPDTGRRSVEFLDQYAHDRWNTVLHYMVGSAQTEGISQDAVQILLHARLVAEDSTGSSSGSSVTRAGFQFLLMDTPSQVWNFMLQYLSTITSRNMNLNECLNFLFQLSFAQLGKDYSTSGLSNTLLIFLQHLREFGLVYQKKRSHGRFYPTRLALNIASGEKKSLMERHREGYIVVETNFRLYAYTDSDLQVALIGLFTEIQYRFPNLAVALITRDSVRAALRGGIKAAQICRFLRMHAHPKQQEKAKRGADVPPTVIDQIYLWEKERDRFTYTDGVLYNGFLSQNDFEKLRSFAETQNVLIWDNPGNRNVVVTREGHDRVRRFWKDQGKK